MPRCLLAAALLLSLAVLLASRRRTYIAATLYPLADDDGDALPAFDSYVWRTIAK